MPARATIEKVEVWPGGDTVLRLCGDVRTVAIDKPPPHLDTVIGMKLEIDGGSVFLIEKSGRRTLWAERPVTSAQVLGPDGKHFLRINGRMTLVDRKAPPKRRSFKEASSP